MRARVVILPVLALVAAGLALFWPVRSADYLLVRTPGKTIWAHVIFPMGDESPVTMHYAEHLAWMNALGGKRSANWHSNAWTSATAVGYWLSGTPEDLPDLLTRLAGLFKPIELDPDFARQERDIVLREYEHTMTDNLPAQVTEAMDGFLYKGNAIAASVIGTPQAIAALRYDRAQAAHAATHLPDRARLVVIGDLSHRQVRRAMAQAGWPTGAAGPDRIAPPDFTAAAPDTSVFRFPDPDAASRLVWRRVVTLPQPVPFDLLEARAALLRDILDTSLPGGLAGPLRYEDAIARSFSLDIEPLDEDTIELSFGASPDKGVSLTQLRAEFETVLSDIAARGIPPETFQRVVNRFEHFWPDWDDADETARWMADYTLRRARALRMPLSQRELMGLRKALSLDTTNALLRQVTGAGRTAYALVGPEDNFK